MNTTSLFLVSGALLLGLGATASAQTTTKPVEPHNTPSTKTTDTSMPSHMNSVPMTPARASKIIGTNVVDASGKDIAEIKDLMVCENGDVAACVERKDDMYICVPMSQLEARLTKSDEPEAKAKADDKAMSGETPNIKVFAYTGDRAKFDSAPGVKDMKMVDGTCMKRSMDHFSGHAMGDMGDKSDMKHDDTAMASMRVPCAKKLIGQDVKGTDGEKIGDIKDLAIDLHKNKVAYAIVSTGGVLGVGDKLHAVSFDRLTCTEDACTVPMTKDGLSALPAIDIDRLPTNPTASVPTGTGLKNG